MALLRQGSQFIVVGLAQLLLDWLAFVLASALGMPVPVANLLGRVCGALLGFWLNGRYTFAEGGAARLGWKRLARFLALWIPLTLLSTWLVSLVAHSLGLQFAWLAKPIVEGLLAAVSFFAWRHLVYR